MQRFLEVLFSNTQVIFHGDTRTVTKPSGYGLNWKIFHEFRCGHIRKELAMRYILEDPAEMTPDQRRRCCYIAQTH